MQTTESYVFYKSFLDAMETMSDVDYVAANRALHNYALNEIEPNLTDLSPIVKTLFVMARPQIDANKRKRKIGKDNGLKGGAPIGNQNARKNKDTVETKTTKPLLKNNANVNANANNNANCFNTNKREVYTGSNLKNHCPHCNKALRHDNVLEAYVCEYCKRNYKDMGGGVMQDVTSDIF